MEISRRFRHFCDFAVILLAAIHRAPALAALMSGRDSRQFYRPLALGIQRSKCWALDLPSLPGH
jgi:hypothetical protein